MVNKSWCNFLVGRKQIEVPMMIKTKANANIHIRVIIIIIIIISYLSTNCSVKSNSGHKSFTTPLSSQNRIMSPIARAAEGSNRPFHLLTQNSVSKLVTVNCIGLSESLSLFPEILVKL